MEVARAGDAPPAAPTSGTRCRIGWLVAYIRAVCAHVRGRQRSRGSRSRRSRRGSRTSSRACRGSHPSAGMARGTIDEESAVFRGAAACREESRHRQARSHIPAALGDGLVGGRRGFRLRRGLVATRARASYVATGSQGLDIDRVLRGCRPGRKIAELLNTSVRTASAPLE